MDEANKLVGTGKRHLVMGDIVSAVNVLQDACSILAKKYGDTADECGEAFFLCGKALLELARMENTVLGNALEGVPEEDAEEETPKDPTFESTESVDEKTRDELRVKVYDAMAEEEKKDDSEKTTEDKHDKVIKTNGHAKEANMAEAENNVTESPEKSQAKEQVVRKGNGEASEEQESSENKEEQDEDGGDEEGEGDDTEACEDAEGEGDGTAEKDSDDEEVGNLQLAWEMLEIAKVIYKRKESKEDQLLAAQTHLKLGEVAAESGNYTQAVEDFQECLDLQLKHLAEDSRLLAETHYQLGLALSFSCQYSQAIEQFNSSASVIKSRLGKLTKVTDKAEGPEAAPEERKEMEELKALLPEIQEKVEDATEGLETDSAATEAMKKVLTPMKTPNVDKSTVGDASSKLAVSDISHLVRKKRKPEESPVKENDTKKIKRDPPSNGVHNGSVIIAKDTIGAKDEMQV
ncbi:histone-binding protein N1/N2-like [Aplochiton taeniatus]